MVHLDLFSGIGGFAYAIDQVWDNVEHIFVEVDKFCQMVLRKHWPESEIIDDIKSITDTTIKGLERSNWQKPKSGQSTGYARQPITLLTGGFPCQPFSAAGVRRGTSDERYLWPEMFRIIRLSQPQWVIAENVRGLLTWNEGVVFEQVCTDLESEEYEVWPFIIPAIAVNAPHRRDRIWWVAHNTANARYQRPTEQKQQTTGSKQYSSDAQNPISKRGRRWDEGSRQILGSRRTEVQDQRPSWQSDWLEVATELCGMDDGLPTELDGFELSKPQHRKERLKGLGNAIVPQVAVEIMRGIA